MDLSPTTLTIVALISLVAGLAKVAFGIGAGVFLTPILALVLPPKEAVALMSPVMLITDMPALRHHWGKWDTRHLMVLLPTNVIGLILGALFLAWAPPGVVRKMIGVIALLFVIVQLRRMTRPATKPGAPMPVWGGWIVGFAAGIATSIAHSGGIVLSVYLLTVGLTKSVFVSTVVGSFSVTDFLKMFMFWELGVLTWPILLTGLALTPVVLIGGRLGIGLNRRLSVEQFTRIVVGMVGVAGLLLLAT